MRSLRPHIVWKRLLLDVFIYNATSGLATQCLSERLITPLSLQRCPQSPTLWQKVGENKLTHVLFCRAVRCDLIHLMYLLDTQNFHPYSPYCMLQHELTMASSESSRGQSQLSHSQATKNCSSFPNYFGIAS